MECNFEIGDVVVWGNNPDHPRKTWIDFHVDGPFIVVKVYEDHPWVGVESIATGQRLGMGMMSNPGAYHAIAFRKDPYLTAIYHRRTHATTKV